MTVTDKDRKNLKLVHLNFQCLRSKRSQLKLLANYMGPNVILGISANWLQNTDNKKFWNVISTSHELFWCHRSEENVKKTAGGVMLFVPWILAFRERRDLNLFDKSKFDSLWIECPTNFAKISKDKMLNNIIYNTKKSIQAQFLEDLALNIDNSI